MSKLLAVESAARRVREAQRELDDAQRAAREEFVERVQALCTEYGLSIRPNGYEGARIDVDDDAAPVFEVEL